jgi:hypothetical protein
MAKSWTIVFLYLFFVPWVVAEARFTNPGGTDNKLAYVIGSTVTITWVDGADYSVLSLGLSELGNGYITWLICMTTGA